MKGADRSGGGDDPFRLIGGALTTVRQHLRMDIAYLSEIRDTDVIFHAIDDPRGAAPLGPGGTLPKSATFCDRIGRGELPELIPDTALEPKTAEIPITRDLPVGSHISIPITRDDGRVWGMFCCIGHKPNPTLNERDLDTMRAFAGYAGDEIRRVLADGAERSRINALLDAELAAHGPEIALQPIVRLTDRQIVGMEALARFQGLPLRPPGDWFHDADAVDRLVEVERAAIDRALACLPGLAPDLTLSINLSPTTLLAGGIKAQLARIPPGRITLEITEHIDVADLDPVIRAVRTLSEAGHRIAIDDVGTGYSGLERIVRLCPDVLKLDISLIAGVSEDRARRAVVAAMLGFAREIGADVVAEGVETEAEYHALNDLGVIYGQGFLLGHPEVANPRGKPPGGG